MIVLAGEVGLRGLLDALRRPEGERILHRLPPAFRRGFSAWAGEREEAFGSAGVPEGAEPFSEGVFQALWRLGEKAGSGFTVSLEALRPHQYVIELCERLDLNPYRIPGLGYAAVFFLFSVEFFYIFIYLDIHRFSIFFIFIFGFLVSTPLFF